MFKNLGVDKPYRNLRLVAVWSAAALISLVILTGWTQSLQARGLAALSQTTGVPSSLAFHDGWQQLLIANGGVNTMIARLQLGALVQIGLGLLLSVIFLALSLLTTMGQRKLGQKATCDHLTGLPNRRRFCDVLSAVTEDAGPGNDVALLLMDVDGFKTINDTWGHDAGDTILRELARRIKMLPSNNRFVARLGGDEFAIVLVGHNVYRDAQYIAQALCKLMEAPFVVDRRQVNISLSIGISYTADGSYSADNLLKHADIALYAVKLAGRRHFRFYSPGMESKAKARAEMERDLRAAIARNELELYFQPMIDLCSKEIVAYEALSRWHHPTLGYVPPQQFIKIAEEIGEMRTIGDWVIRQACETAQSWPVDIKIAINLSPRQFEGDCLVPTVIKILRETGIDPSRLEFEITESLLITDKEHVAVILQKLRELGVRIALDDFGTGYSSFSYLHRFPVDKIKIDQSFVRDIASRPEALAIIESIIFLAKKLGVTTTVEGIESETQAVFAQSLGCNEAQGYHYAKPHPAVSCRSRSSKA